MPLVVGLVNQKVSFSPKILFLIYQDVGLIADIGCFVSMWTSSCLCVLLLGGQVFSTQSKNIQFNYSYSLSCREFDEKNWYHPHGCTVNMKL